MKEWESLNPKMYMKRADDLLAFNLKSGSNTVKAMGSREFWTRSMAAAYDGNILLYMRCPIERFVSGWRYFSYDRQDIHIDRGDKPNHCTLERWFEYTTKESPRNLHWVPVTVVHTHEGRFLPTDVRPLSALPSRANTSSALNKYDHYLDAEPHMRAVLEDWYKEDIELWRSVIGK